MRCPMTLRVFLVLTAASLVATQQQQQPSPNLQTLSPAPVTGNQGSSSDDNCECVPFYQCQNDTIITTGMNIIDIRVKGVCEDYLKTCCKLPEGSQLENKVTPQPQTRRGCGQRNPDGVGYRITGNNNNEAQFGEFPWMVAILRGDTIDTNSENFKMYQCGGALIHPRAVLTAAHCVNGITPTQLKIRAGEWDTQTENEPYPYQDRDVDNVIVHENFHAGALFNDVAILILNTPVDLAENVDVVCLPQANEIFDGARCFATGWGKNVFGKEGQYQVILKSIDLPVVPRDVCQIFLRRTRLGKYFILDPTFICAGGEANKDTCTGDGGGPLVCPLKSDPTRYAQVGIVAWGIGCGENQVPGVYASVAALRQWIDVKMTSNSLSLEA